MSKRLRSQALLAGVTLAIGVLQAMLTMSDTLVIHPFVGFLLWMAFFVFVVRLIRGTDLRPFFQRFSIVFALFVITEIWFATSPHARVTIDEVDWHLSGSTIVHGVQTSNSGRWAARARIDSSLYAVPVEVMKDDKLRQQLEQIGYAKFLDAFGRHPQSDVAWHQLPNDKKKRTAQLSSPLTPDELRDFSAGTKLILFHGHVEYYDLWSWAHFALKGSRHHFHVCQFFIADQPQTPLTCRDFNGPY